MKKQKFTLIELLTVIGVIGILAALLFPAVGKTLERARITQARNDLMTLVNAVKQYENTYGVLPVAIANANTSKADSLSNGVNRFGGKDFETDDYDKLTVALSQQKMKIGNGTEYDPETSADDKIKYVNMRKLPLLQPGREFSTKGYVDPWGNRYVLLINAGYNRRGLQHPKGTSEADLVGSVFAYSFGPNGEDDDGMDTGTKSGHNCDDITSWTSK